MTREKAQQIVDAYDRFEEAEEDISTERLLAMTSNECGCDDSDVTEALFMIRPPEAEDEETRSWKGTFADHKEQTAKDCEQFAGIITELAASVREGNMAEFERFWIEGGTEEGDAKLLALREMMMLRYMYRQECISK